MLYHLFYPLATNIKILNIFKYLTFRTIYAMITALLVCFILGPLIIRKLESMQARQIIRTDGPESHLEKQGTPTMGGLVILSAIIIPTLLWADLTNQYVWITLIIVIGYGLIGFIDDYRKVVEKNTKGLSARQKMFWQFLLALGVSIYLFQAPFFNEMLYLPFFKNIHPDLGILFIPFATLVIVGASNAVNLTDGLDGLAIGPVAINAATYMLFAYIAGHDPFSIPANSPRRWRRRTGSHLWSHGWRQPWVPLVQCLSCRHIHGRCRVPIPRRDTWYHCSPDKTGNATRYRWWNFRCRSTFCYFSSRFLQIPWKTYFQDGTNPPSF